MLAPFAEQEGNDNFGKVDDFILLQVLASVDTHVAERTKESLVEGKKNTMTIHSRRIVIQHSRVISQGRRGHVDAAFGLRRSARTVLKVGSALLRQRYRWQGGQDGGNKLHGSNR